MYSPADRRQARRFTPTSQNSEADATGFDPEVIDRTGSAISIDGERNTLFLGDPINPETMVTEITGQW